MVPFGASPRVAPSTDDGTVVSGSLDSGTHAGSAARAKRRDVTGVRRLQHVARRVVFHKWFDRAGLLAIVYSSVCLALDNPRNDPDSSLTSFLRVNDIIICVLFSVECVLKVIAVGPVGFSKSSWNVLDVVVVIISIMSVAMSSALRSFKTFRTLRVLRPLRVISRNEGMKIVVNALLRAIPAIGNVVVVLVIVLLMFSVVFVDIFKGGLYSCQGPATTAFTADMWSLVTYPVMQSGVDNKTLTWANGTYSGATSHAVCDWLGGVWAPVISPSFDNVGLAFLALFQSTTAEGWNDIEFAIIDSRGIDMQPVRDYNPWAGLLVVLYMVICTFFMINLFIGVIIDSFARMKEESGDFALMTEFQRAWVRGQVLLMHTRPVRRPLRPPMGVRADLWDVVTVRRRRVAAGALTGRRARSPHGLTLL